MPAIDITLRLQDKSVKPQVIVIQRGSYGPNSQLNFTIQKADGSKYAITGLTLNMVLYEIHRRIALSAKELTIVSDLDGTAKYIPAKGEFDIIRTFYMKVSLEDASNKEWTEEVIFEIQ